MIFDPVSFNDKKISETLIVPGLKINAVLFDNVLEEHTKSQIDINSFADNNNSSRRMDQLIML